MNGDASFTALRDAWPSNSLARMTSGPSKQEGPGRLNMAVDLGDQSATLEPARVPLSKPRAEPRDGPDGARNSASRPESWPTQHGHSDFQSVRISNPIERADILPRVQRRIVSRRATFFEFTSFPVQHAYLVTKILGE